MLVQGQQRELEPLQVPACLDRKRERQGSWLLVAKVLLRLAREASASPWTAVPLHLNLAWEASSKDRWVARVESVWPQERDRLRKALLAAEQQQTARVPVQLSRQPAALHRSRNRSHRFPARPVVAVQLRQFSARLGWVAVLADDERTQAPPAMDSVRVWFHEPTTDL